MMLGACCPTTPAVCSGLVELGFGDLQISEYGAERARAKVAIGVRGNGREALVGGGEGRHQISCQPAAGRMYSQPSRLSLRVKSRKFMRRRPDAHSLLA